MGRQVAALLDPEAEVPGVTAGTIRAELRDVAVLSHVEGQPLDPAAGDLAVTASWGYLAKEGTATMPGQGSVTEREDGALDIFLNEIAYWAHVPSAVWRYTLGGYPVLKKWLSYREQKVLGRDLYPQEARAFTEIARRIAALVALQAELDANYASVKREG